MARSADRTEQLREEVGPAAGGFVRQATEVIAPWAEAAGQAVGAASEQVSALAHEAVAKGAPLAQQVAEQGGPRVRQAVDRAVPLTQQAVQQAVQKATPYAVLAKDKVSTDALPKLGTALAAAGPVLSRVRGGTPEPVTVAPPKKRGRGLAIAAVVTAGAAAAFLVVRRLLGDGGGAQWQTARPSAPYVPPTAAATAPGSDGRSRASAAETAELYGQPAGGVALDESDDARAEDELKAVIEAEANADEEVPPVPADEGSADRAPSADDTTDRDSPVPPAAFATVTADESSPADEVSAPADAPVSTSEDNSAGVGPDAHPSLWTEHGAYVGTEPPEAFTIKANERSMKYHLPDSAGYNRTLSEIWFRSEADAEAAGFVRAQR